LARISALKRQHAQEAEPMTKHDDDNHSNQLNPNNDAYWESRGEDERPDDWEQRADQDDKNDSSDK
jgi:hypothetical protein